MKKTLIHKDVENIKREEKLHNTNFDAHNTLIAEASKFIVIDDYNQFFEAPLEYLTNKYYEENKAILPPMISRKKALMLLDFDEVDFLRLVKQVHKDTVKISKDKIEKKEVSERHFIYLNEAKRDEYLGLLEFISAVQKINPKNDAGINFNATKCVYGISLFLNSKIVPDWSYFRK